MSTIFISHVEEDTALARELAGGMEAAGYSTWHYQRDTVPGAPYLTQVRRAIEECSAVLLIVSSKSLDSNQVTSEVVRAFESGKHFIPVLSGITDAEFKERQPLWGQALGASTSIFIPPQGISAILPRIIDGLKALGVQPEGIALTPASHAPRHLAKKILEARANMEGERKQVTVLFADVSGFTSLSEKLDPEEVHNLVGEAMVFLAEEVHRYEGTIAQFLGDGIMALFGAPIAHEDAPQRALHAAMSIRERIREYAAKLKLRGIEFDMHFGVNTGLVIVGRIGDDLTMEYTAIGDTVNLASRMETTATPGTIRVAESTYRLTEGYFKFKPLGEIEVKGKEQPVKAYQLLGLGKAKTRLGASVARGLTPFVGRQNEIEQLTQCYERVNKGQGQVVGIVGEAGVGKSRLLFQLRETLPQEEYTYVEGGCFHYGDAVPYLPLLNILRYYFGIDEGEPEPSAKQKMKEKIGGLDQRLETLLPPLYDIFSLKVEDEKYLKLDPQRKREKAFEAIRNLLLRQSHDRSLVLAVEDLHWMDKTSEEFLGQFITSLAHSHVLLILLYRPEYTNPWTSRTYYSQIRVDELSQETSAEMVEAMLHQGKAAPELQELILSRTAGNPLFMEELTRSLLDRGFIQRRNSHYVLAVKPSDIQVPETVQAIIGARIDRLDENVKWTMQVASVIGRNFSYPLLEGVLRGPENLNSLLADLQASEFVYEERLFPELEYIFKHALIQEVAYNSLLIKRRKEIHGRIGEAIERIYPSRLEEFYEVLGHHYSKSEQWEKAFQYLKLSGQKAARNYSQWEAFRAHKEALSALEKLPATAENKRAGIEVRLMMDLPMFTLGYPAGSIEILQEGESLSRELGDEKSLANFQLIRCCCFSTKGRSLEGLSIAEALFKRAEEMQDFDLMVASGWEICANAINLGQNRKGVEVAARCIAMLENARREAEYFGRAFNTYCALLGHQGVAMAFLGRFAEGEEACEKGLRFARVIADPYSLALSELLYGDALTIKGDGKRALEHLREALQHCEATQFVFGTSLACQGLGLAYTYLGDMEAALLQLERAIKISTEGDTSTNLSMAYICQGMVHFFSGDMVSAERCAEEGVRLAQQNAERAYEGFSWCVLGAALGAEDPSQSAKAEEYLLKGITILEEIGARSFSCIGHLFLGWHYESSGQRDKALEHLTAARAMFEEMGICFWLTLAQSSLDSLPE